MEDEAKTEPKTQLQSRVIVDPETDCWHYTGTLVGNGLENFKRLPPARGRRNRG